MESPLISSFTEAQIVQWFGSREVIKARPYVDAIHKIEFENGRISAWVQGNARAPYRVRIEFPSISRPNRLPIVPGCTCPVGFGCKHGAAVLLAALKQRHGPTDQVRQEIRDWLEQLPKALQTPKPLPKKAKASAQAIFYCLTRRPPADTWEVQFLKATPSADGGIGRANDVWTNFETALKKPPSFLTEADEEILHLLWAHRGAGFNRYWATGLPLAGRHQAKVLPRMLATGRAYVSLGKQAPIRLRAGESRAATLVWQADQDRVRPQLVGQPAFDVVIPGPTPWYIDARRGELGPMSTELTPSLLDHLLRLPALGETEARMVASVLEKAAPALPRPINLVALPIHSAPLKAVLEIETTVAIEEFDEYGEFADDLVTLALPTFCYGDRQIGVDHRGEFFTGTDGKTVRIQRDDAGEKRLLAALKKVGMHPVPRHQFDLGSRSAGNTAYLFHDEDEWFRFDASHAEILAAAGWDIRLPEDFVYKLQTPSAWIAELTETGSQFALFMGIEVDGQRLPLAPMIHVMLRSEPRWFDVALRAAIPDDESVVFMTPKGSRVALPAGRLKPLVETLVDLLDRPSESALSVSLLDTARLVEATAGAEWQTRGMDTAQALHDRIKASAGVTATAAPEGFGARLRPYQLTGLAWLQYLREHRLGGILADDMGLGKTAQTLAHLLTEKHAGRLSAATGKKGKKAIKGKPALIVLPTSLVFNWKREAAQFAPQLKVLSLHGNDRKERFAAIGDSDVVLTTYPLVWRDAELLQAHEYHSIILDEAQTVKNAASRAAATVRELKADHRLCLTGTPLENHLGELWAQFDFLLPGFLGDAKQFTSQWRNPIEKRGDALRRDLLARRIRPFILRRKKEDVAKELPPKSIIVRTVELEGAQRDLYETVRSTMDKKVRDEIAKKGFARSQIVILDALLKLRQTCCDPRLLKSDAARKVKERAKLDLLMEMLPELVDEGRRVLVFSQFAAMLDLIEAALAVAKLPCVRLSGQTKDRETPISRFQNGEVPIFLISLKAGGVGLNLTAADTVIHYDPWWNPAAENQATDRAHRIGQTKQVFVYKLIVAGSIEEKILGLQDKKAALAEGILSEKGDALAKFSADDISALLAPLSVS